MIELKKNKDYPGWEDRQAAAKKEQKKKSQNKNNK